MKWPFSFDGIFWRKPAPPGLTQCSVCHREMELTERTTMTGEDMRTYRSEHCNREEIVNFGPASGRCSPTRERKTEIRGANHGRLGTCE